VIDFAVMMADRVLVAVGGCPVDKVNR